MLKRILRYVLQKLLGDIKTPEEITEALQESVATHETDLDLDYFKRICRNIVNNFGIEVTPEQAKEKLLTALSKVRLIAVTKGIVIESDRELMDHISNSPDFMFARQIIGESTREYIESRHRENRDLEDE